jgi:hypothetical protein
MLQIWRTALLSEPKTILCDLRGYTCMIGVHRVRATSPKGGCRLRASCYVPFLCDLRGHMHDRAETDANDLVTLSLVGSSWGGWNGCD